MYPILQKLDTQRELSALTISDSFSINDVYHGSFTTFNPINLFSHSSDNIDDKLN